MRTLEIFFNIPDSLIRSRILYLYQISFELRLKNIEFIAPLRALSKV